MGGGLASQESLQSGAVAGTADPPAPGQVAQDPGQGLAVLWAVPGY